MLPTKILWPAALLLAAPLPALASVTTYVGEDIMSTTSDPHPNSATAAAAFGAAVPGAGLITFESAPLGSFGSLTVAPGVALSGTDVNGDSQTIRNTSAFPSGPTLDGYNTTPSGANFAEATGGTLTFNFATAVDAFGAYLSGVQNFTTDVITFSDGASQTLTIPEDGTSGSVGALVFVGFTDPGKSISSVTINVGSTTTGWDDIGVDDVRYAPVAAGSGAPEPVGWALMLLGFGGVGGLIRGRRARAALA
ncbi:hypothetical protein [Phenylobacterium sp.]|uniref:hypothetical protein n=1 Tax=Phenylobacterium sp. TaxID=1871053 RepID=UPI001208C70E|nr:hypothetical protein [Phenylobacterium sp.]THD60235.1 MAG: hypothetical protein E8A49_14820 [Phenylobacterium sp.]